MDVQINYLAVLLAALSSMVVGAIWYSPAVFFKQWSALATVNQDPAKPTKGSLAFMYGSVFIASLITAYVLAHVIYLSNIFFKNSFVVDAVSTAFWVWLAFTAARLYTHDTFEGRRKKLTLLNAAHELVTLLIMGVIIGVFSF